MSFLCRLIASLPKFLDRGRLSLGGSTELNSVRGGFGGLRFRLG
jgi:hypothetical protein